MFSVGYTLCVCISHTDKRRRKKNCSVDWKLHLIALIESPYFQFYHMKQTHTNFTQFICGVVFDILVQKIARWKCYEKKKILFTTTQLLQWCHYRVDECRFFLYFLRLQALSTSFQRWRRNHEASFTLTGTAIRGNWSRIKHYLYTKSSILRANVQWN